MVGATVSAAAYIVSARQAEVARLTLAPISDVEGRLAGSLGIDSAGLRRALPSGM